MCCSNKVINHQRYCGKRPSSNENYNLKLFRSFILSADNRSKQVGEMIMFISE